LLRILVRGELDAKLAPPPAGGKEEPAGRVLRIRRPARQWPLRMSSGAVPLPAASALRNPRARPAVLARLAHHELQAVELFAFALLRWPGAPAALRAGWAAVLADEQRHCRLYLQRLYAHGACLAEFAPHSDYFWRFVPALDASPAGPAAFLAAMGLTLEQANLDFSLLYRDAFRAAGDEATARVCQRVHEEEQGHVALALRWLRLLDPEGRDDVARYERAVPFPLSAARAKARRFDAGARRRAGLSPELVEYVRRARSSQEQRPDRSRSACRRRS